jgi:N-acetylneuraminic acid mutarotase
MKKLNNLTRRWIRFALMGLVIWLPLPGYSWSHPLPPKPFTFIGGGLPTLSAVSWSGRSMTVGERVAHQRAIEEVYWRHRLWSATNPGPKPRLEEVMSQAQIEAKVKDYLHRSEKLENDWQRPITDEMLRSEITRMAAETKRPDVLKELWAALGNDPFVIAECLARPLLVKRARLMAGDQSECAECAWAATSAVGAPGTRYGYTALWTGSEMIVWGGYNNKYFNTGGRYDPATDTWTPTSTVGAPNARRYQVVVWTGSEMVLWGGSGVQSFFLADGARYNPLTDTWAPIATANAPAGRYAHTAVWTGGEMIIWGGNDGSQLTNTGGRYDPVTDTWMAIRTPAGLEGRRYHRAVWTGNEMIVWGGQNNTSLNTGGRYNPATDGWTLTSTVNAPAARRAHTAVWTGSEMIVWGGAGDNYPFFLNTGSRYDPATDSWTPVTVNGAPAPRYVHTAVWTGNEMIIWGGASTGGAVNTGGQYNPVTNSWKQSSTAGAPTGRYHHTAVWTGIEMIIWGPDGGTGGRYYAGQPLL